MKKKMALLATALVGASMGLVACKTNIGWLDEKICEHKEYKLVEVVDATCAEEGEKIMECVKCGKKATEKIEKIAHTDDGEGTCEVCEEKFYDLVAPEKGELVAGNTYRIYASGNSGISAQLVLSSATGTYFHVGDIASNSGYLWWSGNSGPIYYLEGFEVVKTDTYVEFNMQIGTYKIFHHDGTDTKDTYVIDEETTISSFTGDNRVYRVVAIE